MIFLKRSSSAPPDAVSGDRRAEGGFALALSLALLSFLALLVLALVALIGVEARVAESTRSHRLAREHAKVALQIALGQLKENLGPDRRVTARGDFLNHPDDLTVEGGRRYWTGVWESSDPTVDPVWLISGDSPDPQSSGDNGATSVPLVGSTGESSSDDDRVLAPSVEVRPDSSSEIPSGRYAYWVGDEGLKAKLNLPQGSDARVASSFGVSAIDDFDRFDENVDGEIRDRLLSNGQLLALDFTSGDATETLARNFHDVTLHSKGVIANVKTGGLRKDLTAGLQYNAMDKNGDPVLSGTPIFEPSEDDGDGDGDDDSSQGMGFVPGQGFPELAGFTMMNNIQENPDGTCRPTRGKPRSLFPFNNRCRLGDVYEYNGKTYNYTLYIEDLDSGGVDRNSAGELIGDLKLTFFRMSDGSIMVMLDYTTGAGYNHTVVDPAGRPVAGLKKAHCNRWRNGEVFSGTVSGGVPDLSNDPGAPMWDQLRDFYNLRASDGAIAARHQLENQVGVHPVISTAQFFYCPTAHDESGGRKQIFSHVLPAIVLWNPYDVDIEANEYTVAVWGKEKGLNDEYKVYYNSLNICEKNYYRWHPRKNGGPEGEILDVRQASVDIKGKNPAPGYPQSRWPYIDTDGEIGIDLIACRPGKIWTFLNTVPGETYEVRLPYGLNKQWGRRSYVRRGIVSWDGIDMATFEGNTDLFNYGTPQDYASFSVVATSTRTRLEIRSDNHPTCHGATVGVCKVTSSSGYPASKVVDAGFNGNESTVMNKMGFVLRNVSGLKAGEAMIFTPTANHLFKQYRIGRGCNNYLDEGWHGGYSFYRRTSASFDSSEPPTDAETWINGVPDSVKGALSPTGVQVNNPAGYSSVTLSPMSVKGPVTDKISTGSQVFKSDGRLIGTVTSVTAATLTIGSGTAVPLQHDDEFHVRPQAGSAEGQDDVYLALFEGNVDVDSSYEDPLLVVSQASFVRQASPQTYPIQRFNKTAPFDPDDLYGMEGRKYDLRFTAGTGRVPSGAPAESDRIRWLANYNPRAHVLTPSPYEHEDETGSMPTSGLGTVPNYYTYVARAQDGEWEVSTSGSGDQPFVGYSHDEGPVKGVLFEVPKDEAHFHSIGQLMHANLSAPGHDLYKYNLAFEPNYSSERYAMRGLGYQPAYAIGNSLADPRILLTRRSQNLSKNDMFLTSNAVVCDAGMHYDYSYRLNDALWDHYFFSTVPRDIDSSTLGDPLPNPRIKVHYNQGMAPDPDDLISFESAAANLLIDGAFNVNSTSVKAWSALLASFFGTEVQTAGGSDAGSYGESPFLRMDHPHDGPVGQAGNSASTETYAGFRKLDAEEIESLAKAIVEQIQLRSQREGYPRPFTSLSEFVNRFVPSDEDESSSGDELSGDELLFALKGTLQAAIDNAGLNDRLGAAEGWQGPPPDDVVPEEAHQNFDVTLEGVLPKSGGAIAASGAGAAHAPGYLTQADLLARLGPCLAVRSDTFRVRAYGETLHPVDGTVEAKAWCEAVYQRVPEVDVDEGGDDESEEDPSSDNPSWSGLHRDFRLVHFRWLSSEEI